jgi:D-glycero-D-manno-heptose 1,7-bisphosphate phosphatase
MDDNRTIPPKGYLVTKRRAVFLDRDGVLNRAILDEHGRPLPPRARAEFSLLPQVTDACRRLKDLGYLLICVTNQPDLARGGADPAFVDWINERVRSACGLDQVRMCPHDDGDNCSCRKPKPGMIVAAASEFGICLPASFMIGDRYRDIEAGQAASCRTILVDRGYPERRPAIPPDVAVSSLREGVDYILKSHSNISIGNRP